MYATIGTYYSFEMTVCCPGSIGIESNQDNSQSSKKNNRYQLLHTNGFSS